MGSETPQLVDGRDGHGRVRGLYVCYLSLNDPLVHTQVVAYLEGLVAEGHCIHLLTFETGRLKRSDRHQWRQNLAEKGIAWHGLRYHKRPSLPATLYDTLIGALRVSLLVRRYRITVLHARAHVPAAMCLLAGHLVWPRRSSLIFDLRGLMAEEYEDAGRWVRGGIPFRLTKRVERWALSRAVATVVLTERMRSVLLSNGQATPVHVIPCCADIQGLQPAEGTRQHVRAALGIDGSAVMIYVGKFTGWYMEREMVDFFGQARDQVAGLHFLVLTQGDRELIHALLAHAGAGEGDFTITSAAPDDVGDYLAAADFAISFIKPVPSKIASSPTKIGEYLGAGLPIVTTSGVGDLDRLLSPEVAATIDAHDSGSYHAATAHVKSLIAEPATASRCRALAETELSLSGVGVPRYRALYAEVAARANWIR